MVEIFFGTITRQAIRRGTFTSVKDLIAAIEAFIDGRNEGCQPFIWTTTVNDTWMSDSLYHPRLTASAQAERLANSKVVNLQIKVPGFQ